MPTLSAISTGLGIIAAAQKTAAANRMGAFVELFRRRFGQRPVTQQPTVEPTYEFSRLEAEVLRLHRERAQITAENQFLNEIIGRSGEAGASRLLRRLVPQPAHGLAALIDLSNSSQTMLAVRGTVFDGDAQITITEDQRTQLRHESLLIRSFAPVPGTRTTAPNIAIQEQATTRADREPALSTVGELFLIPIKEDDALLGLLVTTSLWPGGLRRAEQVEILARLGQTIMRRYFQERRLQQHENDLWLAREMLRLKSIADCATDQPLDTLGELTSALCGSSEMDRAALYLFSRRATDEAEPVVQAGAPLPPTVAGEWRANETRLIAATATAIQGQFLDKSQLESSGIPTLWGQAAAFPLRFGGKQLGTLILSRRSRNPLADRSNKLIEWTADLLAQTVHRIYRDASIRRQARHDGLTDLANRRTFDTLLAGEVDRVRLGLSEECSLLLADLDRFKSINDRHGHQAGDEVLRVTAQLLREHVGRIRVGERSLLARYGGEELAILLPGVGTAGALRIAEEIRAAVHARTIHYGDHQLAVTVSIGVASCPMHGIGAADLVAAADRALYRAKSEGRNRVCRPQDS